MLCKKDKPKDDKKTKPKGDKKKSGDSKKQYENAVDLIYGR